MLATPPASSSAGGINCFLNETDRQLYDHASNQSNGLAATVGTLKGVIDGLLEACNMQNAALLAKRAKRAQELLDELDARL